MKFALVALALLLVIATALPLLRLDQWWIRVFDFPRAQITIAGIVILGVYLYFWDTQHVYESAVLVFLVLATGYRVVKMIPYTVLMPKQVLAAESGSGNASLSLLVANVLMDNRESQAFLDIVRQYNPDMIDPRIGRGMFNTFNAKIPFLRWPLDHVFHSDHLKLVRMEKGPPWGSDHFPIFIKLRLESGAKAQQEEPETNREEAQHVKEKIGDGKSSTKFQRAQVQHPAIYSTTTGFVRSFALRHCR